MDFLNPEIEEVLDDTERSSRDFDYTGKNENLCQEQKFLKMYFFLKNKVFV